MKPLRVLLACRDNPRSSADRMIGHWSYQVPEFTWDILPVPRWFVLDMSKYYGAYDLIVHEDTKAWGVFHCDRAVLPVAYIVRDSTLSDDHYIQRIKQAWKQADIILVDWDRLERFQGLGHPVLRFSHCVNDRLFRDYGEGKMVDVAFHMAVKGNPERAELREWLRWLCITRGWTFENGVIGGEDYARSFSRAKVTLNMERTPTTRAHRVFDAMACRTCLLTTPEPDVEGEERRAGVHYVEWRDRQDLILALGRLLDDGEWEPVANAGYELVQRCHTWAVRARELREALAGIRGEWAE